MSINEVLSLFERKNTEDPMHIFMTAAEILPAICFFGCLYTYRIENAVLFKGKI